MFLQSVQDEGKPLRNGLISDQTGYSCELDVDARKLVCDVDLVNDEKNDKKPVSGAGKWYWYWM